MARKDVTVHGFRSSFRDWVAEEAGAARELAESALAHQVGSDVERAYARSDLLERRRELMERWLEFANCKPQQRNLFIARARRIQAGPVGV